MIKFDTAGFRSEFQLDIVNLKNQGLRKIGRWETNVGIQWKPGYRIPGVNDEKTLRDKHFLVLISLVCSINIINNICFSKFFKIYNLIDSSRRNRYNFKSFNY